MVVFPTEPVMPMTRPSIVSRATRPRFMSATPVSPTTIADRPTGSRAVR